MGSDVIQTYREQGLRLESEPRRHRVNLWSNGDGIRGISSQRTLQIKGLDGQVVETYEWIEHVHFHLMGNTGEWKLRFSREVKER